MEQRRYINAFGIRRWSDPDTGCSARLTADKFYMNFGDRGQCEMSIDDFESMLFGLELVEDIVPFGGAPRLDPEFLAEEQMQRYAGSINRATEHRLMAIEASEVRAAEIRTRAVEAREEARQKEARAEMEVPKPTPKLVAEPKPTPKAKPKVAPKPKPPVKKKPVLRYGPRTSGGMIHRYQSTLPRKKELTD